METPARPSGGVGADLSEVSGSDADVGDGPAGRHGGGGGRRARRVRLIRPLGPGFRLRGRLGGYLATSVVNRVHDLRRRRRRQAVASSQRREPIREPVAPDRAASFTEQAARLNRAVAQLPDEQREVLLLRLKADMKFRDIAKIQQTSINTVVGRYRYGLNRLRSTLNGEVET